MNLFMPGWLDGYQYALGWVGLASFLTFVFSLLLLPWLVRKIPVDYFKRPVPDNRWRLLLQPINLLRNALGLPVLLAGIAMLVLPGQGILTIMVGMAIMQFPGKYTLERWLVRQRGVLIGLNWLRRKVRAPELEI